MKSGFETGFCTWKHCRTFLENGRGQQVQNPDGSIERFCPRHWHEYIHNLEVAAEEFRRQHGEGAVQGLLFGAALVAIVILLCFEAVLR